MFANMSCQSLQTSSQLMDIITLALVLETNEVDQSLKHSIYQDASTSIYLTLLLVAILDISFKFNHIIIQTNII